MVIAFLTFLLLGLIIYEQTEQFSDWSVELSVNHWISAIPLLGFYGLYQAVQGYLEMKRDDKFMGVLFFLASPITLYITYVFIDVITHSYWNPNTEFMFLIFIQCLSILHFLDYIYHYQKKQRNKELDDVLDL